MLAHIQSGRPLREGTVERLRRTIRRFRALNFVDDDALAGELAAFEQACLDGLDPERRAGRHPTCGRCSRRGSRRWSRRPRPSQPRSVLTGRALRRFDVEAEDGTGDTERPGAVSDAPTAA